MSRNAGMMEKIEEDDERSEKRRKAKYDAKKILCREEAGSSSTIL